MLIQKLTDSEEWVNALYWGEPGSGKTSHGASMAKVGRILVFDFEAGVKETSLRRLGIPVENVDRANAKTYADVDRVVTGLAKKLDEEPGYYVGVLVDSVSEMAKRFTENLTRERHAKRTRSGMVDDEFEIQLEEHGRATEQLRRVARNLRDLPCHTVFTALEKRDKDGDGYVQYRPSLGPKFSDDLRSFVNVMIHTEVHKDVDGNLIRVGYTQAHGKYKSKDNLGILPEYMLEPSFHRLTEYIGGNLTIDDITYTNGE